MYDRRLEGKTLTLAVSGKLWQNSLVMIDVETKSLWSHLLGRAMRGKLIDKQLKPIASVMTDWKSWKKSHPETTVIKLDRSSPFNFNRRKVQYDSALLVIGMTRNRKARAWRLDDLKSIRLVNDVAFADANGIDGVPVVVVYHEAHGTAVIHGRKIDDRVLTFRLNEGRLQDVETKSEWDLLTGTATTGELIGKQLPAIHGIVSYDDAWSKFHKDSTYWKPKAGLSAKP